MSNKSKTKNTKSQSTLQKELHDQTPDLSAQKYKHDQKGGQH